MIQRISFHERRPRSTGVFLSLLAWWFAVSWAEAFAQGTQEIPRTVHDILARLEAARPDRTAVDRALAILAEPPPAQASESSLVRHHVAQARAARLLGMSQRQLSSARQAADIALWGPQAETFAMDVRLAVLVEYEQAEAIGGDFLNFRKAKQLKSRIGPGGWRLGGLTELAAVEARLGAFESADANFRAAEAYFAALSATPDFVRFQAEWRTLLEAGRARQLGARGKYEDAIAAIKRAIDSSAEAIRLNAIYRFANPAALELREDRFRSNLVTWLTEIGNAGEAEWQARLLLERMLDRVGGASSEILFGIRPLIQTMQSFGRFSEALALAKAAHGISLRSGLPAASHEILENQRLLAAQLVALRRYGEALDEFDALRNRVRENADARQVFDQGDENWAQALLESGRSDAAAAMLRPLVRVSEERYGRLHIEVGIRRGLLAMAIAKTGDRRAAMAEFASAAESIADPAAINAASPLRRDQVRIILEAYILLLSEKADSGPPDAPERAFRLADALRGRTVQAAIADAAIRTASRTPELASRVRQEQDLSREQLVLYDFIGAQASMSRDRQLPGVVADMRRRIESIAAERESLGKEIRQAFPEYADLVRPRPPTMAEAQAALLPDEAFVSIYVMPKGTVVWAMRKTGPMEMAYSRLAGSEVQAIVSGLRESLDPGARPLSQLRRFDLAAAHRLYRELLLPLEGTWRGARTLVIVANGALAQIPLSILPVEPLEVRPVAGEAMFAEFQSVPWLAKQVSVVQVPSASALVSLRRGRAQVAGRLPFAGFGDPQFQLTRPRADQIPGDRTGVRSLQVSRPPREAPEGARVTGEVRTAMPGRSDWIGLAQLAPLPDTRDEILSIGRALGAIESRDIFLGAAANVGNVMTTDLANRRVVAFATHGLLPGDLPGLSQPALALSATDRPGDPGVLTLEDVLKLKLNADWVVLSACNTASAEGDGAEAVSGLGRAFFYAGTRAVLVTHWPVESASARLLVTRIFEQYAGRDDLPRSEAVRSAMLELMQKVRSDPQSGRPLYSYAHPLFWAPYALVGDGGR